MEKTTEIDKFVSSIVEELDGYVGNSNHAIEFKDGSVSINRITESNGIISYIMTERLFEQMFKNKRIRKNMIERIRWNFVVAQMELSVRVAREGGGV